MKITHEVDDDAVVEHIGQAYAAIGLLRAASVHKAQNKVFLPDVPIDTIIKHLEEIIAVKPKAKTLRLFRALTLIHLKKLKRAGGDSAHPSFVHHDPLLAFRLWLSY